MVAFYHYGRAWSDVDDDGADDDGDDSDDDADDDDDDDDGDDRDAHDNSDDEAQARAYLFFIRHNDVCPAQVFQVSRTILSTVNLCLRKQK